MNPIQRFIEWKGRQPDYIQSAVNASLCSTVLAFDAVASVGIFVLGMEGSLLWFLAYLPAVPILSGLTALIGKIIEADKR